MPPPILDFRSHAQNVYGMCCVPPSLRRWVRNGPARLFEKSGFDPRLARGGVKLLIRASVCEMQARFAPFTFADYLAAMKKNGVTHACAFPVEPMGIERALRAVGIKRILLGSDWPASEARSEMKQIDVATRGDRAAMRAVLFDNGAELLRRVGATLT